MKPYKIKLFKWAKHVSGTPWMSSVCCESRINHQKKITELEKPIIYGSALPENEQEKITHVAEYSCKCGKTKIKVEGRMGEYAANGCFLLEKPVTN